MDNKEIILLRIAEILSGKGFFATVNARVHQEDKRVKSDWKQSTSETVTLLIKEQSDEEKYLVRLRSIK